MFQNTTAHFRIEAVLIFQLAAITGKGKAECLRGWPPIILHRCQNTWPDAKIIRHKHECYPVSCFNGQERFLSFKTRWQPLIFLLLFTEHLVYCSLREGCITANTGLGRCVQQWSSEGVKPLLSFLFTVAYISFAYLSKPPVSDPPKPKRRIQSSFINLQNLHPSHWDEVWPEKSSLIMYIRQSKLHHSSFTLARCWFPESLAGT